MKHLLSLALVILPALSSARSQSVSSADVADAAEQATGHRSHMGNSIHLLAGETIYGPAQTIRLVQDEKASAETAAAVIKFFEEASAGSVIVAAMEGEKDFALIGASFVTLAKARHLAGFVIDGSVRDTAELRTIGLPVFARGPVPGSAGGHFRVAGINVPIQCAGIEVRPGDIVVGDSDGVCGASRAGRQSLADCTRNAPGREAPSAFDHKIWVDSSRGASPRRSQEDQLNTRRPTMTLRWKQILSLSLLAIVLWAWVTYQLRTHPERSLDPHKALIQFLLAPIGGVISVWLCKIVGRLEKDQILVGVSLVGAIAMMLDGFALGWTSNLYGFDEKTLRLGAAGLLWGYGVGFAVALVWIKFQGRSHTPSTPNE